MEATLPLVSIVIITYNSANYVTETLESISRQTYCGPIELIVSDDCSQDNTLDICRDWLKLHGSMFVHADIIQTSHNSGICANYNNALKHVRGEWIKYIAGDDMLMPRCIERFVEETRACADCFYISGVLRFGEASGIWYPMGNHLDYEMPTEQARNLAIHAGGGIVTGPSFFIQTQLLRELGGMDMRYPMLEDFPFAFRCAFSGHHISIVREALVMYRVYAGSVSNSDSRFHSMYHQAIYQARKEIALRDRRYIEWYHNHVMKIVSRHNMSRSVIRHCVDTLLKATDAYGWMMRLRALSSSLRRVPYTARSWRDIRHGWHC